MTQQSVGDHVAQLLGELAESRSVDVPPWEAIADRRDRVATPRNRRVLVAALAAVALLIVAGLAAVSRPTTTVMSGPVSPGDRSIGLPAILVPDTNGPAVSSSEPRLLRNIGEPDGAVAGPGGTIYSLGLALATDEEVPGDVIDLAGFDATVLTDGSAPTQIYRTIDLGCVFLTVTTADAPALSSELTTLVESTTVEGVDVTIDLPPGWTSYGTARPTATYFDSTIQVGNGASSSANVFLSQSPGAPIGVYLHGETAPVLLVSDETDQLWHIAGATTPGWNALVGKRLGTAFQLAGEVPVEVLRSVADTLTAADAPDALPPSGNPGAEMAIESGAAIRRQGCPAAPLTIEVNG